MEPSPPQTLPAVRDADHREQRWRLVRDLAVFQAKLFVDGVKDLVLFPVSLVAALVGLVTPGARSTRCCAGAMASTAG
jgi:hypothetical protein